MSRSFSDTEREGGQVPLEGIACAERQESEPGKEQCPFLGVKQLRGVGWGPEGGAGVGLQRQARAIPVGHVHRAKVSGYCLARRFHSLVE